MILASGITVTSSSTISLAVLLSIIAMVSQVVSIFAIFHNHSKEGTKKEVEMTKNFTRLEVKLDTIDHRTDNISKAVELSDAKLDKVNERLSRSDERINTLFTNFETLAKRVEKLEEGK